MCNNGIVYRIQQDIEVWDGPDAYHRHRHSYAHKRVGECVHGKNERHKCKEDTDYKTEYAGYSKRHVG